MEDKNPQTQPKKRKIISDYDSSSSSSNEDAVCHKKKRYKSKEKKHQKTCDKKSVEKKKFKTSLEQDRKYLDQKLPEKPKKEYEEFINQGKNEDKQTELEVWYCLLHPLEESEKLIALKLLLGIHKMKRYWKKNFIKNKYVDKKVVDDMKLVIKTLQDEQEKHVVEKQKLIKEKNELEKKIEEERKSRIQLAELLANEIEKSKQKIPINIEAPNKIEGLNKAETSNKVEGLNKAETSNKVEGLNKVEIPNKVEELNKVETPNKVEGSNKAEDKQQNQTTTQISKIERKKEVDLREILNHRENLGTREHYITPTPLPTRHFSSHSNHPFCRGIPSNFNNRLCVNIKTSIRNFPELMRIIESELGGPIYLKRVISVNEGWIIEFLSLPDKFAFLRYSNRLLDIGLSITNSYRKSK